MTLGTMSIYRGAIYLLSRAGQREQMSREFPVFPRGQFLGVSVLSWISLAVAAAFIFAMQRSKTARDLYAAGGNRRRQTTRHRSGANAVPRLHHLRRHRRPVCWLWVARFAVAYTDIALGFELSVIAACLIGGVAISVEPAQPRASCSDACSSESFAAVCPWSESRCSGRCSSMAR